VDLDFTQVKEDLKEFLQEKNIVFQDLGNQEYDKDDDYPDWAQIKMMTILIGLRK